jgi:glycosyltransferase involved in cell wall biosynthesis
MLKILVVTDDLLGPFMAGSALRGWELARALAAAGHEVRLVAAEGSTPPSDAPVELAPEPDWRWPEVVVAPPWSLRLPAFTGHHRLVIDGATPLLAELAAMPRSAAVRRRRRRAAARLPLVAARADAVLAAGTAQRRWWQRVLERRPEVRVLEVPFGIPNDDPPAESVNIIGVPEDWSVVLWWGGVWPWLDLDTLLAARARLGRIPVSVVVPTATRPGGSIAPFSAADLNRMAARYALSAPDVVPLEHWAPYADRHLVLNRASTMAFLHRAGLEAELSFRTRAMDALWSTTPMLLSAGGEVARLAEERGWGLVVPPGEPAAVADAFVRLLEPDLQTQLRSVLASERDRWRWPRVATPLVEWLAAGEPPAHQSLGPPLLGAAAAALGLTDPGPRG